YKITNVIQNEFSYECYTELCYFFKLLYPCNTISNIYGDFPVSRLLSNNILCSILIFYSGLFLFIVCCFVDYFYTFNDSERLSHVFKFYDYNAFVLISSIIAIESVIVFSFLDKNNDVKTNLLLNTRIQVRFFLNRLVFYHTLAVLLIFLGFNYRSIPDWFYAPC